MTGLDINHIHIFDEGNLIQHLAPPTEDKKTIQVHLIRHGLSEANALVDFEPRQAPHCKDSLLSETGVEQAKNVQEYVSQLGVQVVFASPMRRTLATASHAFEKSKTNIVAWPALSEYYPNWLENHSLNSLEVISDFVRTLPKDINLDNVEDNWWSEEYCADLSRIEEVINFIKTTPLTNVAIVSHWGFISNFFRALEYHDFVDIKNCMPISIGLLRTEPKFETQYRIRIVPARSKKNRSNFLLNEFFSFYENCQEHEVLQATSFLGPLKIAIADYYSLSTENVEKVREVLRSFSREYVEHNGPFRVDTDLNIDCEQEKALFVFIQFTSNFTSELRSNLLEIPECYKKGILRKNHHVSVIRDDHPERKSFTLNDFKPLFSDFLEDMFSNKTQDWISHLSELDWNIQLQSLYGEKMVFKLY
eukprot:TRINITY_DN2632_c0_g1_i1.p1 TRINITY_DN2632_c0_g1~~TRINITY_DN2632_c0_g1_i1.p1  ORF type:complete len:427 (-),score=65.40 TRINITY_DN2632_c0_g1_i1:35-1294(-)